jgi:hypothetical protein
LAEERRVTTGSDHHDTFLEPLVAQSFFDELFHLTAPFPYQRHNDNVNVSPTSDHAKEGRLSHASWSADRYTLSSS